MDKKDIHNRIHGLQAEIRELVTKLTETEVNYKYNDRMGPRRRKSALILASGTAGIWRFWNKNIPGVCSILHSEHTKNGIWSFTVWHLGLAPGVRVYDLVEDFESGRFIDSVQNLEQARLYFGVPDATDEALGELCIGLIARDREWRDALENIGRKP